MKKHNEWLLQGKNESNEDYNARISEFEVKERYKQATKIAELELIEQWLDGEAKRHKSKMTAKDDQDSYFDKGVDVAFGYVLKHIESLKYAREAIMHSPTEYELQLQPDGDYKLGKR